MSITNELRRWAYSTFAHTIFSNLEKKVDEIADRIDAEHEKAVTAAHSNGITKYGSVVAREYVKLPVDADGVPIRLGDTVKLGDGTFEVRRLELYDMDSWDVFDRFGEPFSPFYMHHVQPDSWERIIEDAANLVRGDNESVVELVERCRRLAGAE